MYRKVLVVIAVAVLTAGYAQAQVFVGGGLGVDFTGGKVKNGGTSVDLPSGFAFSFTPKVGYYVSDDFAIGLEVGLLTGTIKVPAYSYSEEWKFNLTQWGVGAFARYQLAGVDKFSLLLEGSIGVQGAKTKETSGSTTEEGPSIFAFGIGVLPVLSYSVTDRLSIEASCDFLRLGFQSATTKRSGNSDYKSTTNTFGLGVNSQTINLDYDNEDISFSNLLTVGLIFKF